MVNTIKPATDNIEKRNFERISSESGVDEYRLSNGMKVLLVENHTSPVVTVLILYKVGSRNEGVGYTGATHFLEHMLFKGTKKHNPSKGNGIDDLLTQIGAHWNATTWFDRTSYYEIVPCEFLELCIKLEADRMRNLLLRQEDRDSEMSVVRNELERGENHPEEAMEKDMYALAFREHPYHHPTIGWRSDVEGVSMGRLREFYDTFYWPDNTTLVILGDFQAPEALNIISNSFGKIKSAPHKIPEVYTTEPAQEGERRFEICRSGDLCRVWVGYHIPEAAHEDTYSLGVIRHVLGSSYERSSRLYKALIDTGLAADVFARHDELRDPGLFIIGATLNPGADMEKAEQILHRELEKLAREPVSDLELSRAKSANSKGTILAKADPTSMAFLLGEAESKADWHWLMSYDDKFESVTTDDIIRVASTYFKKNNRTTGHFKPLQKMFETSASGAGKYAEILVDPDTFLPLASLAGDEKHGSEIESDGISSIDRISDCDLEEQLAIDFADEKAKEHLLSQIEEPGVDILMNKEISKPLDDEELEKLLSPSPKSVKVRFTRKKTSAPSFQERLIERRLPNGMRLLMIQSPGLESIAISLNIKGGRFATSKRSDTIADLISELVSRGSKNYSKFELAEKLEAMGIPGGLEFSVDNYRMSLATHVVAGDFDNYLDLLADVMRNPLFSGDELEKVKVEWTSRVLESTHNTRAVAWNALKRQIYPTDHPFYEKTFKEQLEDLLSIDPLQLHESHLDVFNPSAAIFSLVGDFDMDLMHQKFEKRFGDWHGKEIVDIVIPPVELPKNRLFLEARIPDKTSVDIVMVHPTSLRRTDPDFYAIRMVNGALGQDTITSRLGNVIRDRAGLTYGIYSMFSDTAFGCAPWSVALSVNPQNIDKSIYLVNKVLDDFMNRGISEDELSRESGRALGAFKVGLASSMGLSRVIAELEFLGLGAKELDEISERYLSVTKKSADAAMHKHIHPECFTTAIAGTF